MRFNCAPYFFDGKDLYGCFFIVKAYGMVAIFLFFIGGVWFVIGSAKIVATSARFFMPCASSYVASALMYVASVGYFITSARFAAASV
jgi:hypothetical protein